MHRRKRGWWRRLGRWIVVAGIVWVVATTTLVLLFRFVDPPGSSFMLQRTIEAAIRVNRISGSATNGDDWRRFHRTCALR